MNQVKISKNQLEQKKKVEKFQKITEKMRTLYETKNHDYGDSVSDTYTKFGIDAYLVRMYDKLNRIYNLTRPVQETKVKDETIEDTLMDLANYAVIAMIELQERRVETPEKEVIIQNLFETVPVCEFEKDTIVEFKEGEEYHGKHFKKD